MAGCVAAVALYLDFGQGAGGATLGNLPVVNNPSFDGISTYGANANTPYGFRTWADRLDATKYSVNLETGEVTLSDGFTLGPGQKIYADYHHTGMSQAHNLVDLATRLAASRLGRTVAGVNTEIWGQLQQIEDSVMLELMDLAEGRAGIDLLDNIKLIDETRAGARGARRHSGTGLFM